MGWFSALLNATGGGSIYLAFVTIALAVSFLLARFGGFLSLGSDTVKAAGHAKSDAVVKRVDRKIGIRKDAVYKKNVKL